MNQHFIGTRRAVVALCLGLLVVALGALTASAAGPCTTVCYADVVNGNDANDGDTPATAKKTIQAAVNQVTAGGQVYVLDGLYPEAVTVNKAVTITGNGPANTTVDPTSGNGFGITASNVTLEDLKITDAAQGARLSGTISHITFDNVHFINNTSRGIEMQNGAGVLISDVKVLNSLFDNNNLGIRMSSTTTADGILIENTTFQNHVGSAFQQSNDGSTGWVKNLTVRDSTFTNNGTSSGYAGVYAEEFSNVLIEDSTFTGNRYGINLWDYYSTAASTTTNVVIRNNTFTDHKATTIALRSTTSDPAAQLFLVDNNTINQNVGVLVGATSAHLAVTTSSASANGAVDVVDNEITFSGAFPTGITATYGIYLAGRAEDVRVEGNEIDGGGVGTNGAAIPSSGIRLATSTLQTNANINITKNLINNFVNGVSIHDGSNVFGGVQPASVVKINRNDLSANTGYGIQSGPTTATNGKCNWWGSASGPGPVGPGSGSNVSANVTYAVWLFNNNLNGGNVTNIDTGEVFCSIQEGIDDSDTLDGHTLMASAGVYQENVTVYKKITLDGAGSGSDPLVDTIIDPVTGVGINITSSGTSAADRLVIKDLRVTDAPADGITLSGTGGSYLTLDNVASVGHPGAGSDGLELKSTTYVVTDVKIVNSNLSDNDNAGFRMGTQTKLDGLTVENTTINGNSSGVSVFTHTSAPTFNNITFTNVTISDNTNKGIYVERLNNATFSGLTVTGNGSAAAAFMAGVDINLKYADFNNITIEDSTFENNGLGDTGGSGVDLTIKARNDGSYASQPATLINLDVNHNTFGGASHVAMSVGNNLDEATTTINRNAIGGTNTVGLVVFGTLPATMINAECNWWDDASGPSGVGSGSGNAVTLNADFTPWLYTSDLDGPCFIGGTITVAKVAAGGGNTQFGFDPSWSTTNFTLADGGSQTSPMLQAGSYSVAEVTPLPTGWTLQSATCDNSATTPVETVNPSGITLADGDAWVCTFTNIYTPPPTNVCNVQDSSSLWTDIIGKGMGNPKKHKAQVKLTIPNYAQVDSLYGQMVAKNTGAANYVRFILPGKNNYVQVDAITSPADHNAGNFWYGEYIDPAKLPTKTVAGRWFLQKTGTKNHIPRALVLYPTYRSTTNTWVNIWNTYDAAEGEAYWDTANGWTQERVIVESIAPPNGPTTFNVADAQQPQRGRRVESDDLHAGECARGDGRDHDHHLFAVDGGRWGGRRLGRAGGHDRQLYVRAAELAAPCSAS